MGRRAFTLIELLVVISILALLIAMLLPAIKMVKDSANAARCASNLRQLQLANVAYSGDWEGLYVPQFYSASANSQVYWWWDNTDLLRNFTDGKATTNATVPRVMLCPLSKASLATGVTSMTLSYGMNCYKNWIDNTVGYGFGYQQFGSATIRKFARKVAFIDALGGDLAYATSSLSTYVIGGVTSPEGVGRSAVAYRHRGRANVVYYDGHVSMTLPQDVFLWYVWDPTTMNVP